MATGQRPSSPCCFYPYHYIYVPSHQVQLPSLCKRWLVPHQSIGWWCDEDVAIELDALGVRVVAYLPNTS
jgi:hypothetical protein